MNQNQTHPLMGGSGVCECLKSYSFEPHGNGFALYLGRCPHRHGCNLANITEPDMVRIGEMLDQLNAGLHRAPANAMLQGSHDEAWRRVQEYDQEYQQALDEGEVMAQELVKYKDAWRLDKQKMMDAQIDRDEWRTAALRLVDAYTNHDSGITEVEGAVHLAKQLAESSNQLPLFPEQPEAKSYTTWNQRREEIISLLSSSVTNTRIAAEKRDWHYALECAQESAKLSAALLCMDREGGAK